MKPLIFKLKGDKAIVFKAAVSRVFKLNVRSLKSGLQVIPQSRIQSKDIKIMADKIDSSNI